MGELSGKKLQRSAAPTPLLARTELPICCFFFPFPVTVILPSSARCTCLRALCRLPLGGGQSHTGFRGRKAATGDF